MSFVVACSRANPFMTSLYILVIVLAIHADDVVALKDHFTYCVIGSGPAGLQVAHSLHRSSHPDARDVGLFEQGARVAASWGSSDIPLITADQESLSLHKGASVTGQSLSFGREYNATVGGYARYLREFAMRTSVPLRLNEGVETMSMLSSGKFQLSTASRRNVTCDHAIVATGRVPVAKERVRVQQRLAKARAKVQTEQLRAKANVAAANNATDTPAAAEGAAPAVDPDHLLHRAELASSLGMFDEAAVLFAQAATVLGGEIETGDEGKDKQRSDDGGGGGGGVCVTVGSVSSSMLVNLAHDVLLDQCDSPRVGAGWGSSVVPGLYFVGSAALPSVSCDDRGGVLSAKHGSQNNDVRDYDDMDDRLLYPSHHTRTLIQHIVTAVAVVHWIERVNHGVPWPSNVLRTAPKLPGSEPTSVTESISLNLNGGESSPSPPPPPPPPPPPAAGGDDSAISLESLAWEGAVELAKDIVDCVLNQRAVISSFGQLGCVFGRRADGTIAVYRGVPINVINVFSIGASGSGASDVIVVVACTEPMTVVKQQQCDNTDTTTASSPSSATIVDKQMARFDIIAMRRGGIGIDNNDVNPITIELNFAGSNSASVQPSSRVIERIAHAVVPAVGKWIHSAAVLNAQHLSLVKQPTHDGDDGDGSDNASPGGTGGGGEFSAGGGSRKVASTVDLVKILLAGATAASDTEWGSDETPVILPIQLKVTPRAAKAQDGPPTGPPGASGGGSFVVHWDAEQSVLGMFEEWQLWSFWDGVPVRLNNEIGNDFTPETPALVVPATAGLHTLAVACITVSDGEPIALSLYEGMTPLPGTTAIAGFVVNVDTRPSLTEARYRRHLIIHVLRVVLTAAFPALRDRLVIRGIATDKTNQARTVVEVQALHPLKSTTPSNAADGATEGAKADKSDLSSLELLQAVVASSNSENKIHDHPLCKVVRIQHAWVTPVG